MSASCCAGPNCTLARTLGDRIMRCGSVGTGSSGHGSTILAGSGRVTGQCDRPGVLPCFCSFFSTRFIVAFGEKIRHFGTCVIPYTLDFHVVLFTSSDSSNLLLSGYVGDFRDLYVCCIDQTLGRKPSIH